MRKKRILALLLALLSAASLLAGCGTQQSQETLPVITVGCDTYPPFSYVDVDGNRTGIDV